MKNVKVARKKLDNVMKMIGPRQVRMPILIRYLNKEFKSMSIKFRSMKRGYLAFSGYFTGDIKEDGDLRYNIFISYGDEEKTISPNIDFYDYLFAVMVHELRHGYQDRKHRRRTCGGKVAVNAIKNFDSGFIEMFFYLSNPDELDAYAYEVAYAKTHDVSVKHRYEWIINRYRDTFQYAPKVFNRFLNKVYKFSQRMIDDTKNRQYNSSSRHQ